MEIKWTIHSNHFIGKTSEINLMNKKIAAFDLDDTLIKTKSGKDFYEDVNDWEIYDKSIPGKLFKLINDGYQIVIISNQLGISKGKTKLNEWTAKVQKVIHYFKIEATILCSIRDDLYRKPRVKLWDTYIQGNRNKSFFCGDAGGIGKRNINNQIINKDFSDSDLKFAKNLGIRFMHRDEFIFNVKHDFSKINYPLNFDHVLKSTKVHEFEPQKPELIINVGFPASGKSTYTLKYIQPHNYVYINLDIMKDKQKCFNECHNALAKKQSVVIDNTNLDKETRKKYIEIAHKNNIKIRCFLFTTSIEVCRHNSYFRNYTTQREVIPKIVFHMMRKKYEEPSIDEGFSQIVTIDFNFDLENKSLYQMYFE
jgi:bifunctional polynucleotide phosphatase/kinase